MRPLLLLLGALTGCAARAPATPATPTAPESAADSARRAMACAAPDAVAPPATAEVEGWPGMELPDGKVIRRLAFVGSRSIPTDWLAGLSPLKVGERFDQEQADALVQTIEALGAFERVDLLADASDEGVELEVRLAERPQVRGVFLTPGSTAPAAAEWSPPRAGDLYDPAAVGRALRSLDASWMAAGRLDRVVEVRARREGDQVDLCLRLEAGPEWLVERVDFVGARLIPADELRATLSGDKSTWNAPGRPFRADLFELPRLRMEFAYYERGAVLARVGLPRVERVPGAGRVVVTVPVQEGPTFRLGQLAMRGPLAAPAATYLEQLGLRSGELFVRSRVAEGVQRMRAHHGKLTGREPEISPATTLHEREGLADMTFVIEGG